MRGVSNVLTGMQHVVKYYLVGIESEIYDACNMIEHGDIETAKDSLMEVADGMNLNRGALEDLIRANIQAEVENALEP